MKTGLRTLFQRALSKAQPVHPIEGGMAKRWIKHRLLLLYPELRNHPDSLESTYQQLNLEPQRGIEDGDPYTYFEMKGPE